MPLIQHMEWQSVKKKQPKSQFEWFSEELENISACSAMLITRSFHVSCQCKWNEWNCSVISCSLFLSFHAGSAVWRFHKAAINWGSSLPLVTAICSSHDHSGWVQGTRKSHFLAVSSTTLPECCINTGYVSQITQPH